MSRRKKAQRADDSSEIDLTPMLDVVFIMLIFFIVTASFVREVGLDINVPEHTEEDEADSKDQNILVHIGADNQIEMMSSGQLRRVDKSAVRSNLERLRAENPQAAVVIRANEAAHTETYVAVADAAYEASAPSVVLVPAEN